MARASIIFVPLMRLLMPMDSSVPWARLSIGSSSGCEPLKPYVTVPRGRVKRESVKPVLMAGTHWMSSMPSAAAVALWTLLPRSVSNEDELGSAM